MRIYSMSQQRNVEERTNFFKQFLKTLLDSYSTPKNLDFIHFI